MVDDEDAEMIEKDETSAEKTVEKDYDGGGNSEAESDQWENVEGR